MFPADQYRLLDFGSGKKIEWFNGVVVERMAPAAKGKLNNSFSDALRHSKSKSWNAESPKDWKIEFDRIVFNLKLTPFGHIGVFPEQAIHWRWIQELSVDLSGKTAINLFAHTGGTTMALASRGMKVVHVDSAKNVVGWARENANCSGLTTSPIRWIVDDAMTFVRRELRRGNRYDFIVADPPSFGHGTKKSAWKFERDLGELLDGLAQLLTEDAIGLLLTCHTTGYSDVELLNDVSRYFSIPRNEYSHGSMYLQQHQSERKLGCGHFLRWNIR